MESRIETTTITGYRCKKCFDIFTRNDNGKRHEKKCKGKSKKVE
jgi:hypothetical protein